MDRSLAGTTHFSAVPVAGSCDVDIDIQN
jgi:hypothetical protein